MSTKTISIMDDAYVLLAKLKRENESFSDELRRILGEKKGKISECAGAWKNLSDKEIAEMKKAIKRARTWTKESVAKKVLE